MVRNSRKRREEGAAQAALYLAAILVELKTLNKELREIKALFSPHAVSGAGGTEPVEARARPTDGAGNNAPAPTSHYSDHNNGDWRKLLEEIEEL